MYPIFYMIEGEAFIVQAAYREAIKDFRKPYSTHTEQRIIEIRWMFIRILHALAREHSPDMDKHKYK